MRDELTLRTLLEVKNELKLINYVHNEFEKTLFNSIKRTNFDTFMGVGVDLGKCPYLEVGHAHLYSYLIRKVSVISFLVM